MGRVRIRGSHTIEVSRGHTSPSEGRRGTRRQRADAGRAPPRGWPLPLPDRRAGDMTPVVLLTEALDPAAIDVLAQEFDVRHVDGTDRAALLAALSDVEAIIVRSATQVDAAVIDAAPKLKVIARAGVG